MFFPLFDLEFKVFCLEIMFFEVILWIFYLFLLFFSPAHLEACIPVFWALFSSFYQYFEIIWKYFVFFMSEKITRVVISLIVPTRPTWVSMGAVTWSHTTPTQSPYPTSPDSLCASSMCPLCSRLPRLSPWLLVFWLPLLPFSTTPLQKLHFDPPEKPSNSDPRYVIRYLGPPRATFWRFLEIFLTFLSQNTTKKWTFWIFCWNVLKRKYLF